MINFSTRIPGCESHRPTLLDPNICSVVVFPPLGNSDLVIVSVSIDCSHANWDSLRDHLRDVLLEDILKLGAFTAAAEFCE